MDSGSNHFVFLNEADIPVATQDNNASGFLKALDQDSDFTVAVEAFEKAIILQAMKRHRTIGDCCKALNLPRSTLDGKRRKYGMMEREAL